MFQIPLPHMLRQTERQGRPMPHQSPLALETILLVEDEPAVRQLFAQALTRAGYTVHEARNGQEAIKLFDEHARLGDTRQRA